MLVKKTERIKHNNSPVCIAYNYPFKDKDISLALIELSGRYPSKGNVVNSLCNEMIFVSYGSGTANIDGKEFDMEESDAILIKPGQKYFLEGCMELIISSNPAWHPEQHSQC